MAILIQKCSKIYGIKLVKITENVQEWGRLGHLLFHDKSEKFLNSIIPYILLHSCCIFDCSLKQQTTFS